MFRNQHNVFLLVALVAHPACGQQPTFDIRDYYERSADHVVVAVQFATSGSFSIELTSVITFGDAFHLFDHTLIKDEFELRGDQTDKYVVVIDNWKKSRDELYKAIRESKKPNDLSIEAGQYREPLNQLSDVALLKLNEVLLPHQIERVNQIQTRMVFLMEMNSLLDDRNFQAATNITPAELNNARQGIPNLIAATVEKADKLRTKALEQLAAGLPRKPAEAFVESWSSTTYGGDPQLMLLAYQLNDEIKLDPDCPDGELETFWQTIAVPHFNLKINGHLKSIYLKRFESLTLFFQMRGVLTNQQVLEQLDLDPQQQTRLTIVLDAYSPILEPAGRLYKQRLDEGWSKEDANKELQEEYEKGFKVLLADIPEAMSKEKWAVLEQMTKKTVTRALGPVVDLLSDERGYPEATRARISENAKQAHAELVKKTKELQEQVIKEFLELFDDESAQRLKEMFGPPIESAPPNLDILLLQIKSLTE